MGGVDIGRRRAATPPWPGLVIALTVLDGDGEISSDDDEYDELIKRRASELEAQLPQRNRATLCII